jgi:hypothetical protein
MALTQIAFGALGSRTGKTGTPAIGAVLSEDIVPSGSNQATTAVAQAGSDMLCRVATDEDVYVAFGPAADATVATARFYVPTGAVEYFAVNPGDKAAVVQV